MTKQLECLVDGCDARIEGETVQAVTIQAQQHASREHSELELDEEMAEKFRRNVTDV